jgi:esterase/lipase superfamily enzyme
MELLVFGHAGARVLVFPTRCGRFFDYENFGLVGALRSRIEAGHFQLYCVDSVDHESLYCNWAPPRDRIRRHQQYEEYVLCEVMPLSAQLNGHAPLMAHGCSLGGFHAINLALRHPQWFVKVVALSGRFDLTEQLDGFRDLLDGHREELVYFHTPNAYMTHAHDSGQLTALRRLEVVLAVGETDPFSEQNRYLSRVLAARGVRQVLHVWSGRAHTPRRWAEMAGLYL